MIEERRAAAPVREQNTRAAALYPLGEEVGRASAASGRRTQNARALSARISRLNQERRTPNTARQDWRGLPKWKMLAAMPTKMSAALVMEKASEVCGLEKEKI